METCTNERVIGIILRSRREEWDTSGSNSKSMGIPSWDKRGASKGKRVLLRARKSAILQPPTTFPAFLTIIKSM